MGLPVRKLSNCRSTIAAILYWLSQPAENTPAWYTAQKILSSISTGGQQEKTTRYIRLMEETARNEKNHAGCSDENNAQTLSITLQRGWVYGNTHFREQMKLLMKTATTALAGKQQNDLDKADHYLKQAQQKWKLTKAEILSKRKSLPEKIALGIILKETSGLNHRAIAQLLNMGHPVSSARLINKGIKANHDQSAASICYRQLLEDPKNVAYIVS